MVLPPYVRLGLVLTSLFFVAVGLVCLQPYDSGGLRAFLLASDGCPAEDDFSLCFMGIRPGVTTGDQALAVLQTHPWVSNVLRVQIPGAGEDILTWDWSAVAPASVDSQVQGLLIIYRDTNTVYSIAVMTRVPFGDFRLALHPPQQSVFADASFSTNIYQVETYAPFFRARRQLPCPVPVEDFWKTPMAIWFGTAKAPDLPGAASIGEWSEAETACSAETQFGMNP